MEALEFIGDKTSVGGHFNIFLRVYEKIDYNHDLIKTLVQLDLSEDKLMILLNLFIYNKNAMEQLKKIVIINENIKSFIATIKFINEKSFFDETF